MQIEEKLSFVARGLLNMYSFTVLAEDQLSQLICLIVLPAKYLIPTYIT